MLTFLPKFVSHPVYSRQHEEFDYPSTYCSVGSHISINASLLRLFDVNDRKTLNTVQYTPCTVVTMKTSEGCQPGGDTKSYNLELKFDFKPEEIDVSLEADRLKIHAKSENRRGVTSEVFKWYSLPANIDIDKLTCRLSHDGILRVYVPFKKTECECHVKRRESSSDAIPEHEVKVSDTKLNSQHSDKAEGHFVRKEVTRSVINSPSDVYANQMRSMGDWIRFINAFRTFRPNSDDRSSPRRCCCRDAFTKTPRIMLINMSRQTKDIRRLKRNLNELLSNLFKLE